MTALDLGDVVGRVILEDAEFTSVYTRTIRRMAALGTEARKVSKGVGTLDTALNETGAAAGKAAVGIDRATAATERNTTETTTSTRTRQRDTQETIRNAGAKARLAELQASLSGKTRQEQQVTLRAAAATERQAEVNEQASVSFRQLAAAEASAIGASRRLASVQAEQAAAARSSAVANSASARAMGGASSLLTNVVGVSGKAAAGLAGVAAAFFSIKAVIGVGNDFRDALNGVQAASRATDEQMKSVSAQAVAMGKDLTIPGASAVDAAQGIEDLVKAGVRLDRAMVAVRPALLLASAASVKTSDAARVLGDVLDDFHLPASKAGEVANYLAAGANSAGGGLMDMFEAMKYVGPRARAIGVPVQDVTTAITMLAKSGIQGSMAGTGLAMMFQRLASESPKGQKALDDLGVSAWDATGKFVGMPKMLDQLHQSMGRMGGDKKRFLKDISDAFGARAANIVASFAAGGIEHWNRFAATIKSGDVQKYADLMNRGIGAGFRQLGKESKAAGLAIYQGLEPRLNSVVQWLGTNLPKAVDATAHILTPAAHLVGAVFGAAWTVAGGAIKVVASILGSIGGVLERNRTLVTALTTAVLGYYAAAKLIALTRTAFTGAALGVGLLRNRIAGLGGAGGTFRAITGAITPTHVAILGVAAAVAVGVHWWDQMHSRQAAVTEQTKALTAALQADNGVIAEHTRETIASALQSNGAAKAAQQVGVSLGLVARAAAGSAPAVASLNAEWEKFNARYKEVMASAGSEQAFVNSGGSIQKLKAQRAAWDTLRDGVEDEGTALKKSSAATKEHAALVAAHTGVTKADAAATDQAANSLGVSAGAYKAASDAAKKNAAQTAAQTLAYQLANDAASLFQQTLDKLAGINLSVATAQTGLAASNLSVAAAFKQNGKAIDGNSAKAVANQQAIQGQVSAAQQYAQAVGKQTHSSDQAVAAFKRSKTQLEDQLRAQHKLTPAVQAYIDKLYNIKNLHVPPTKLDADTRAAAAKVKDIQARITAIRQNKVPGLDANSAAARGVIADLNARIYAITHHTPSITFDVETDIAIQKMAAVQRAIDKLTGGHIDIGVSGRGTAGLAGGGIVNGPGTGTSDTAGVFALSRGEAVIPEKAVSSHPGLVRALIRAGRGMASGGVVGSNYAAIAALLRSMGATKAGIAGFLGNTKIESGGSTKAYNPGENAHGFQQWEGGRLTVLQGIARKMGVGITSQAAQLAMIKHELTHGYGDTLKVLRTAKSASSAAAYVDANYERSSGSARGARMSAASAFYRSGVSAGGTATAASAVTVEKRAVQARITAAQSALTNAKKLTADLKKPGTSQVSAYYLLAHLKAAESALGKAGAGSFVTRLQRENAGIMRAVTVRNAAAKGLAAAASRLKAVQAKLASDRADFTTANMGGFDITAAGGDGDQVTGAGILAQSRQAVTRLRAWAADIKRLSASKTFPAAYIRQLAGKGPDALPQVQALLSLSKGDLLSISKNYTTMSTLAGQAAQTAAVRLDQPAVTVAQASYDKASIAETRAQTQLLRDVHAAQAQTVNELRHLHMTINWTTGTLSNAVKTDARKSSHR